jgi:ABC-2 type transport system permease protein
MDLHKIWLIAKREYLYNFRRRSFLFTAFGVPLITIGAMALVFGLVDRTMGDVSSYKRVGVVDKGRVFVAADGTNLAPLPAPFEIVASEEESTAGIKDSTLDGLYVLPVDFLQTGKIDAYNRPNLALSEGIRDRFTAAVQQALVNRIADKNIAARLQNPTGNLSVYHVGSTQKLDEGALLASFFVPFILGMLIFISTTTTSQFLMSGLVEEKENRMMEMFVTSARPTEMLFGKIVGLGSLGITQLVIWGVIGFISLSARSNVNIGQTLANLQLTPGYLLLLIAYFILGYLVYGSIMFGIGATVNAEQESRQIGGLVSMVAILPFIFSFSYFTNPDGPLPRIMSLVPLTAPVGMVLRMSWANVPPVDIVVSLGLLVLAVMFFVWLAARIFRSGMLNYGKRFSLRDMLRSALNRRRGVRQGKTPNEKGATL